jgi:hypothetical protein
MAQQPQPPWQYSETFGGFFVYEPGTDLIIIRYGQQFLRPAHVDAATLAHASYERRAPLPGNSINNGQVGRQSDQVIRGRGRGRQGQDRGRGRGRGRGQGRAFAGPNLHQSNSRPYERRDSLMSQPSSGPMSRPPGPQMLRGIPGIVSDLNGMTISSQPSSSLGQLQPQPQNVSGLTRGFDPDTQVQTLVDKSRPELVTPPELLAEGIYSRQRLIETQSGNAEKLDSSFFIRSRSFFSVGRVFKVLWAEPAGGNATVITNNTFQNHLGERVHSKVRWFVVIREGSYYCGALPIATYGGRGVAKPGVVKSEHGIIYTGRSIPRPDETELPTRPNEQGMRSEPIQVDPDSPIDRLDPKSRINFAAVSTVHHNIKAKSMGMVNRNSIRILLQHFQNVWFEPRDSPGMSQYHQHQQYPTTGTLGPGRVRDSLNLRNVNIGKIEGGDNEVNDEDAEGGDDEVEDEEAEGGDDDEAEGGDNEEAGVSDNEEADAGDNEVDDEKAEGPLEIETSDDSDDDTQSEGNED